ncbi:MAG: DUF5343 domain-containing protein [Nitrospinae bacterium]|nr:DUF5343 domain-containing protein [Nitrospinota bacterium]
MNEENGTKKAIPPYLAFSTVLGFIESMAASGLPHQIDKSIMKNMSGTNQSWTLSCLKFLQLTSEKNKPTEKFKQLVAVDGEERKKLMKDIVIDAYPFIFHAEGFDLKTATPKQLDDQFESTGAVGETKKKSIRFFMTAAKHAGIEISSHLNQLKFRTRNPTKNKKNKRPDGSLGGNNEKKGQAAQDADEKGNNTPSDRTFNQSLLDKIPPFNPEWSEDTLQKWLDTVRELKE